MSAFSSGRCHAGATPPRARCSSSVRRAQGARLDEGDVPISAASASACSSTLRPSGRHSPTCAGSAPQASYPTSIVLLGPSASALERLPSLELLEPARELDPVPLDVSRVHDWNVEDIFRRETIARAVLERSDPSFLLAGPDGALVEAKARRDAYGARMALIGGSVAVGLFGFALIQRLRDCAAASRGNAVVSPSAERPERSSSSR